MNSKKIVLGIFAALAVFTATAGTQNTGTAFSHSNAIIAEAADDVQIIDATHARVGNYYYYYNDLRKYAYVTGRRGTSSTITIPSTINLGSKGIMNVTAIDSKAFANDKYIRTVDLSNSNNLVSIGSEAFSNNTNLRTVKLAPNVSDINHSAFYNCTKLQSFNINGNKLRMIQNSAFENCVNLTSIKLPNSLVYIKVGAFQNSGLTGIMIPNKVTKIEYNAFKNCKQLKEIKFEASSNNSKLTIGERAFANLSVLQKVQIDRVKVDAAVNIFENSNYMMNISGTGVVDYTQMLCTKLIQSWGLKYNPNASYADQKKFFTTLAQKIKSYITYDTPMTMNERGCAATVLSVQIGTCGGFSRAYYNCCLAAGVSKSNVLVGGDRHCHAWNYVKVNREEKWYIIDSTNYTSIFTHKEYSNKLKTDFKKSADESYDDFLKAHDPSNFYVCIDNQTGTGDETNYANPHTKKFDQVLREGTANGVPISGTRA